MNSPEKNLLKRKVLSFALCLFLFVLSLHLSRSSFGLKEMLRILSLKLTGEEIPQSLATAKVILFGVRLPRLLMASFSAASLGVAGVLSQGLFRNPLASPSLIGSTSGGLLGAVLCLSLGGASTGLLSVSLCSFIGSLSSTACLLFLFYKLGQVDFTKLLLIGLSFSTFTGAVCQFIISFEDKDPYKSMMIYRWFMGGFYHIEWDHFLFSFFPLLLALSASFFLASSLDVLSLGDEVAESLGVPMKSLKVKALLLLSLLLGIVTSLAGPLPFVGLMAPHITRELIGARHKELMKYTILNSISLVLLADLLAKNIFSHKELELGILLSLIGAPFFLYLTLSKKSRYAS